ncbi:NusA-like transcription termination signal-binding factor [Haloplanus salinus]|jgi:N utilization substance protein A|uniref:Probable transcription termination protein NusA n=1 Tax=Haloplanus salinus TaxID=1126245 RepID=A0A368NDU4_9EURY|nr:NusA-like transcription termination signal-binding factor [Haloplanus salinus]RCU47479.1 NusA-like transcription termination signal-binding factor [Haloplanus salinus]
MRVTLSDRDRRFIARFEDETGATARDCLIYDEPDRVVFLVAAGEMAQAVGPGGRNVRRAEETLGRTVELVENADTPEAFVANALSPAAVTHVTISEQGDRIAYAEVPDADRGAAIGRNGRNIETARQLARRHYELDDVQLT